MKDFELKKKQPLAGIYKNLNRNRLEVTFDKDVLVQGLTAIEARRLANWLWDAAKAIELVQNEQTKKVS